MKWKRASILILVVFGGIVAVGSLRGFDDHVPRVIPPALAAETDAGPVRFTCASPFGSASVTPSDAAADNEFPLEREPCEKPRNERRLLAAVDVLVVVIGLLVLTLIRDRSADASVHEEPLTERETGAPPLT